MGNFIALIGASVLRGLSSAGEGTLLLRSITLQLPYVWKMRREVLEQMHVVLIGSMPLVLVTSLFIGAVTAVQAVYQMQGLVPMKFLGVMISKTVFTELGPVLMALVVGSRLCAFYAAELGTMKVTEQLDAMSIMAIDPVRYLAMPRFVASVVMIPIVTIFANSLAIFGGYVVSVVTLDISSGVFIEGLQMFYRHSDIMGGLIKTVVFGGIIGISGIYNGFATAGGAEGVGKATMRAVVGSCLSVLVADYFLAIILFQIIFKK